MHRFFPDPDRSRDLFEYLTPEDAHHAFAVLRLRPGDLVEVVYQQKLWKACIVSIDHRDVCVQRLSPLPTSETRIAITLFQGLPKADKMDWIVQKATEIGVTRIVPVTMKRCVVRLSEKDGPHKLERWNKISREAGKQCGRCVLPEIYAPLPLRHLTSDYLTMPALNAVPWEEMEGFGPKAFCQTHISPSSLGILIGPEGGIEPDEIDFLKSVGFIPITLGKRILRTETAGLVAVAAILSQYGEMD